MPDIETDQVSLTAGMANVRAAAYASRTLCDQKGSPRGNMTDLSSLPFYRGTPPPPGIRVSIFDLRTIVGDLATAVTLLDNKLTQILKEKEKMEIKMNTLHRENQMLHRRIEASDDNLRTLREQVQK